MKKRYILTLLISLPLLLTSCDPLGHEHNWSDYFDNGDGTHSRMCLLDSTHIESGNHNFSETITKQPTDNKPGELVKKCQDCGYEETIHLPPTGSHVYDQEVVSDQYIYEKHSDYSGIYYKSDINGAYGDLNSLFEYSELPEGYSNIEYIQNNGNDFIDTGIEKNSNTSISYSKCKVKNGRLPYGYQEVEYIEFTGKESIDTRISGNAVWNFDIQWKEDAEKQLMGYGPQSSEYFGVKNGYYAIYSISTYKAGNRDQLKFDYETKDHGFYVNDQIVMRNSLDIPVPNTSFLIGSLDRCFFCEFKFYSGSVTKNGVKVADFVPCYNTETLEIGLYDLVTFRFFTNNGKGSFLKGNDVIPKPKIPEQYQEVAFLESTFSQYINTQIPVTAGYSYSIKFCYSKLVDDSDVLGAQGNETLQYGILVNYFENRTRSVLARDPRIVMNLESPVVDEIYKMQFDFSDTGVKAYVNGELKKSQNLAQIDGGYPLALFARKTGSTAGAYSYPRIFSYSVSNSDGLLLDYVPCYRKEDKKPGFYNLVDNTFVVNSGTGPDLILGPVVESSFTGNTKLSSSDDDGSPAENIKVGYYYNDDVPARYFEKIYDAYVYENEDLVQKLIPALRNSDSAIGMFDLIGKKFYEQNGSFKNSGVINHKLDVGVVSKEPTMDEEGKFCQTCSICGAKIYSSILRLAYKVSFELDEGIKELQIFSDNNPNKYEVKTQTYTRNPYTFNNSIQIASVWFKVVLKDGYEFDKVDGPFGKYLYIYKDDFHYLTMIQDDLNVKIITKKIS